MKRFQNYIKDVISELKKVTWPTWDELKGATLAVIIFSLLSSVYVFGVDWSLMWIMENLIGLLGA